MSLCCLCCNAIQGILHKNEHVEGHRQALVRCLLKFTGLKPTHVAGKSGIMCIKCEKDLENVEKFLSRINEGHRNRLLDVPMEQTQFAFTGSYGQSEVMAYNKKASSEPIQRVSYITSNPENCESKIDNASLPGKRIRRPPKRYRDDEDNYKNLNKNIKISTCHNKLHSLSLSLYPKMAQLRSSNGNIIGDLVEVQRRGKHSRLRILCRECPEAFTQERLFRQHLLIHTQAKDIRTGLNDIVEDNDFLYLCTLCEKTFHIHSTARRHFKTSHNENRPFQCEFCPAAFKYKTNLDYHRAKHLNHKNHQCPQCQKKFVLRYELQVHLRIHTGEKPFRCQICSMAFAHRSNLQKHRQAHRQNVTKMIKCHKCKTLFKSRICFKRHYERIHKYCNHHGAESSESYKDTKDFRNLLNIHEVSKCVDYNFTSGEGTEYTNNFQELPKSSSPKLSQNFVSQPIAIPVIVDKDTTDTSSISDKSHKSSDIGEALNGLSFGYLARTNSAVEKSSISQSSISATINGEQFDHVHYKSPLNTKTVDFMKTCKNLNIQPIKSGFINMLPKNFKIIKIPKMNNTNTQVYYTKPNCCDATKLCTSLNNKPTFSEKILTSTSLNDTSYLLSQVDNKFITVQNTSENVEMVSFDDSTEHNVVPEMQENLQIEAYNGLTSCNNKDIFPDSKCYTINPNHVTKDIELTADCTNEINKEIVTWNHFQNPPHKPSFLKSVQMPTFNITNIDAKVEVIHKQCKKVEKYDSIRTTNLEEGNFNQIWENAEKIGINTIMNSKNNKSPFTVSVDSSTIKNCQLKHKLSPHSLLKSQLQTARPQSKPIITNVEVLPQLNLEQIQSSLLANEGSNQPSTPYVVKVPEEYKFQCSICWKYFKLKSALTKHLRTHTGEKPYKCNVCPKSYADASNYKKHKMLHTKAADALNISRPKPPPSPALSNVTDPDPDGIEVMQTIQPFELSSGDSDDDMESYLWQDALQHSLMNKEIRENIRRNLKAINSAIMPAAENINIAGRSLTQLFSPNCFQSNKPD